MAENKKPQIDNFSIVYYQYYYPSPRNFGEIIWSNPRTGLVWRNYIGGKYVIYKITSQSKGYTSFVPLTDEELQETSLRKNSNVDMGSPQQVDKRNIISLVSIAPRSLIKRILIKESVYNSNYR